MTAPGGHAEPTPQGAPARPLVGAASLAADPRLDQPGAPSDNWSWWARTGLAPWRGPREGVPDPGAVLSSLAAEGANAVGVHLDWARIAPAPGSVDGGALAAYADLLAACGDHGLLPVVTLQHRTHPGWLGEEFWLTPGSPDLFADHVALVLESLADLCRHWVTVLAPGRLARQGWVTAEAPPGRRRAMADAYTVLDNLMTAHLLAEARIRAVCPGAIVALGHEASDLYDEGPLAVDLLSAGARQPGVEALHDWLRERRGEHATLHPAARPVEAAERAAAGVLSPFGRRGRPGGGVLEKALEWGGGRLRRPCPCRAVTERLERGGLTGPDAVVVVWDLPQSRAGLAEWCRIETGRHGLPLWILMPGGGGWMPSRGELVTLRGAERAGTALGGWFRLVDGPLLAPHLDLAAP